MARSKMANSKDNPLFPSLMSRLGIGGSTSGLLSDLTGGKLGGMSGVLGGLMGLQINKPATSPDKETEIQRFSDPMKLKDDRRDRLRIAGPLVAGSPQLGGTGKSLGNIEYQFGLDDAWNNYINSDMTPLDAQIYQNRIRTLNMQSKYGV